MKAKILIEVRGGCVVAVHTDTSMHLECAVLDWDNEPQASLIEGQPCEPDLGTWFEDGTTARKFVLRHDVKDIL